MSAFRSALLSSIITNDGPSCGPSPKKALSGKIDTRHLIPLVIVLLAHQKIESHPTVLPLLASLLIAKKMEVFCLSNEEVAPHPETAAHTGVLVS